MNDQLPEGWSRARFADLLIELRNGLSPRPNIDPPGIPILRISAVRPGAVLLGDHRFLPGGEERLARYGLRDGDLLFTRYNGTLDLVGVCGQVRGLGSRVCLYPDKLMRARVNGQVVRSEYVEQYFQSPAARGLVSAISKSSAGQQGISGSDLKEHLVPLAPLAEQGRIVAKVEALLARVNAARERLVKVPLLLKRFRQSVLAAACSGRLTQEWRDQDGGSCGSVSLEDLLAARRAAWIQAEAVKLAGRGRSVSNSNIEKRYKEPRRIEEPFEVPATWAWASLDALTLIVGGVTKGQRRSASTQLRTVPYLRVANVQRGHLDLREIKTIEATEDEISELRLQPGDMLLNEGGDIDKLGRGWVWAGEIAECIHQNHVFRARPASRFVEPRFLSHFANTFGQEFFFDAGAQTVNLASISMSKLKSLPVPCPPVEEQREILRRVDQLLGLADKIEGQLDVALVRSRTLTPAILQKAFAGELVATEAELAREAGRAFETAEELLRRNEHFRTYCGGNKQSNARETQSG